VVIDENKQLTIYLSFIGIYTLRAAYLVPELIINVLALVRARHVLFRFDPCGL